MIMHDCSEVISTITSQFGQKFHCKTTSFGYEITTPFLYPDNTSIVVSVEGSDSGQLTVSDKGSASDFAFLSGIADSVVSDRLEMAGRRFRLDNHGDEMRCDVPANDIADGVLRVSFSILDVAYLTYRQQRTRKRKEFEIEVQEFLVEHKRRYRKDFEVRGRTRMRTVDFHVYPDGYQQMNFWVLDATASAGAIQRAENIAFAYVDIEKAGESQFSNFGVLVRTDSRWASQKQDDAMKVLENYLPRVILWENQTERDGFLQAQAA